MKNTFTFEMLNSGSMLLFTVLHHTEHDHVSLLLSAAAYQSSIHGYQEVMTVVVIGASEPSVQSK